jgi:hypothetical protein
MLLESQRKSRLGRSRDLARCSGIPQIRMHREPRHETDGFRDLCERLVGLPHAPQHPGTREARGYVERSDVEGGVEERELHVGIVLHTREPHERVRAAGAGAYRTAKALDGLYAAGESDVEEQRADAAPHGGILGGEAELDRRLLEPHDLEILAQAAVTGDRQRGADHQRRDRNEPAGWL